MAKHHLLYTRLLLATAWLPAMTAKAQSPTTCATITNRANSNGNANSCPNVNGTAYAANFAGTSYAATPATAKTGNLTITYSGTVTAPYAVTKVWITTTSTTLTSTTFGPAAVPSTSSGNTQIS